LLPGGDAPAAELLEAAQTLSAMMSVAASKAGDESTKKKLNDMLAKLGTVAVCIYIYIGL
jgi:hypothetical protein